MVGGRVTITGAAVATTGGDVGGRVTTAGAAVATTGEGVGGRVTTTGAVVATTGAGVTSGANVGRFVGAAIGEEGESEGKAVATLFCVCKNRFQYSPSESEASRPATSVTLPRNPRLCC